MEDKIIEKAEGKIKEILEQDINANNIEHLYKLSKIKHLAKEDKEMNYGNYGYGNYGNYGRGSYGRDYREYNGYGDNYGRRGYDAKYRGYEHLDRLYGDYGRYEDGKNRYGANEDTKKSLSYMLESMENFARMLKEDAKSQEEVQMIRETAQRIAQM